MRAPTRTHRHSHARRHAAAGVVCAAAVLLAGIGAAGAHAGDWTLLSCHTPVGQLAPTEGWETSSTGGVGPDSGNVNSCAHDGALQSIVSGEAPQGAYQGPEWVFTAPAGSSIIGGTLTATMTAAHGQAWLGSPSVTYDSADVLANCQYNLACGSFGTLEGVFPITHPGARRIYAAAVCVAAKEGVRECPAAGGIDASVSVSAAQIELSNQSTPAAGGFTGGLLAPGARGTQDLAFTASDPEGPGVYSVTAEIDGATMYAGTPDANNGKCAAEGESEGTLMFTATQPCKVSEAIDLPIDTSSLTDGPHTLKVSVTDAAGNASVVYDGTLSSQNAPLPQVAPSIQTPGAVAPGVTLSATPGQWTAPAGAGAVAYTYQWQACSQPDTGCRDIPSANGQTYTPTSAQVGQTLRVLVTASDRDGQGSAAASVDEPLASLSAEPAADAPGAGSGAQLRLYGPSTISRTFGRSALRLTGRLTDASGAPVAGATVLLGSRQSGEAAAQNIAAAHTDAHGGFAVRVPAGASRELTLTYSGHAGEGEPDAQARIRETVAAGVVLTVSPRHSSSHGRILLSGRVQGAPRAGLIVDLLVRYRGRWEPFRTPRTDSDGRFSVRYQFEGAIGRFPFRAMVPGGQVGLPYASGYSAARTVATS